MDQQNFYELFMFGLGFLSGYLYLAYRLRATLRQLAAKMDAATTIKVATSTTPVFSIEFVDNVILVYNVKTDTFICQANSLLELEDSLKLSKIDKALLVQELPNGKNQFYMFSDGKLIQDKA